MHYNIKAGRNTKIVTMNANLFVCKNRDNALPGLESSCDS